MKWARPLWQEPGEPRVSHSRVLALAAFVVVTWIIIRMELREATEYELVIGYLVAMVLGETSKGISRHRRDVALRMPPIGRDYDVD